MNQRYDRGKVKGTGRRIEEKKVLITGASGLLGRALLKECLERDFYVLAQYHTRQPVQHERCQWLWADFSQLAGIRDFLRQHQEQFNDTQYLINNYGPITCKPITELTAEDFSFDFHHNVVTAFEITRYFIEKTSLQAVVNVGFEYIGQHKAYKKILTYAAAKNALLLLTESFRVQFPHIRFYMAAPSTLEGAEVESQTGKRESPQDLANKILTMIIDT